MRHQHGVLILESLPATGRPRSEKEKPTSEFQGSSKNAVARGSTSSSDKAEPGEMHPKVENHQHLRLDHRRAVVFVSHGGRYALFKCSPAVAVALGPDLLPPAGADVSATLRFSPSYQLSPSLLKQFSQRRCRRQAGRPTRTRTHANRIGDSLCFQKAGPKVLPPPEIC